MILDELIPHNGKKNCSIKGRLLNNEFIWTRKIILASSASCWLRKVWADLSLYLTTVLHKTYGVVEV